MNSNIKKQFYGFIDKARTEVPALKNPTVLFIYQDEEESSESNAFAYVTPDSFMQAFGNFLVQNPQFIEAAGHSIDGAIQILNKENPLKDGSKTEN